MSKTWLTMTASDLGRGISAGEISPLALTQTYLDAINEHPLRDRIYARVTDERALKEAATAKQRAEAGERLSLLDGVPISWKDLFDTDGIETEAGTALLKGRTPEEDAEVLQNATNAGLVCLGKTHMSELAFSGLGYNPVTATPPCVNDLEAVSGGSSSGAATSVAFGLAAAAIGSDTGGSVRIPSAWNDLVGLKTTSGRVSLSGVVPLCASFDTVGPLCRSVEDAEHLLCALEGRKIEVREPKAIKSVKVLMLDAVALDDIRDQPLKGFKNAVAKLSKAGVQIEQLETNVVQDALEMSGPLFVTEAYATWKDEIEAAPDKMYAEILARFRAGVQFSGVEFVQAWQALDSLREQWAELVSGYDAVLLPTSPILPPNIEKLVTDHDYYVQENLLALRNTRIGNLLNCSALTLPTGVASAGLMLLGPANGEEGLLDLGRAVEQALA